ncbi:3-hydroxybutyryl-CoA dehydratase [Bacillus ectoiniformans]|uniref:MaoC family dehydratase n=1 Tax=Bacillus ectoiniformans TaxID=1494429 RepID=UPI0019560707|nr:MaoC family dehydratase [Bacillus ectoiniformans]MBM7648678.1 3-hydroxybutyryl-CoA dehydratase [Bacillus ectoiniformans]
MKVGDTHEYTRTISESDNYLFGGVIGDSNPWHFNEEFCKKTPFQTRIAYGMLPASYFATVFTQMFKQPVLYMEQNVKFLKPVKFNDTITARCTILKVDGDKVTLETVALNQHEEEVLSGTARLKVLANL